MRQAPTTCTLHWMYMYPESPELRRPTKDILSVKRKLSRNISSIVTLLLWDHRPDGQRDDDVEQEDGTMRRGGSGSGEMLLSLACTDLMSQPALEIHVHVHRQT